MRTFDYSKLLRTKWDTNTLKLIAKIYEYKGKQNLFTQHKGAELHQLVEIAKIQSIESSNKIEGIITTSTRMKQLYNEKTTPRNRCEEEIIGYRNVLNTIHESHDYIPLKSRYILQLHRDLLRQTGLSYAGKFKTVQNYIAQTDADGKSFTRFKPIEPHNTHVAIEEICESYNQTIENETIDPLVLIPVFICDFLCIHPFNDGNGRMSRLLTLMLLYKSGFNVGKYISVEKQIEKTKDAYYDALQESDKNWHKAKNDYSPFINYMLGVILACYTELDDRISTISSKNRNTTNYDIVKNFANEHVGKFTSADILSNCPNISKSSALKALKQLTSEGIIEKHGSGRSTFYVRTD